MKKIILLATFLSLFASNVYAINVQFKGFILYEGDKGGFNVCEKGHILVEEFYQVSDTSLSGLTISYSNPSLSLKNRLVTQIVDGYLISNPYCVTKAHLLLPFSTATVFTNGKGQKSNVVTSSISIPKGGLKKASEWGKLNRKKIK